MVGDGTVMVGDGTVTVKETMKDGDGRVKD